MNQDRFRCKHCGLPIIKSGFGFAHIVGSTFWTYCENANARKNLGLGITAAEPETAIEEFNRLIDNYYENTEDQGKH